MPDGEPTATGIGAGELETLTGEGVDRQQVHEIVAFVALKILSNHVSHIADAEQFG